MSNYDEQKIRLELTTQLDMEPDGVFMERVRLHCLETIKKRRKRQMLWRRTYQTSTVMLSIALLMWGITPQGHQIGKNILVKGQMILEALFHREEKQPAILTKQAEQTLKKTLEILYQMDPSFKEFKEIDRSEINGNFVVYYNKNKGLVNKATMRINISNTGILKNISTVILHEESPDEPPKFKGSRKAVTQFAKERAMYFLQHLLGEENTQKYQADELFADISSNIVSIETPLLVNGVPYTDGGYSIEIDSNGAVRNFSYNKTPPQLVFPDPSLAMSKDQMMNSMVNGMELAYEERGRSILKYTPAFDYIDAVTGELLDRKFREIEDVEKNSVFPIIPGNQSLVVQNAEDIIDIVRNDFGIDSRGTAFTRTNIVEGGMQITEWMSHDRTIKVRTELLTGRVFYMSISPKLFKKMDTSLTEAQRLEKARGTSITFLQRYLSHDVTGLKTDGGTYYSDHRVIFYFKKLSRGITVTDHSYIVTVDGESGRVTSISGLFGEAPDLPNSNKAVSKQIAVREFLATHTIELVYMGEQPRLYYRWKSNIPHSYLDAITGKTVTLIGEDDS